MIQKSSIKFLSCYYDRTLSIRSNSYIPTKSYFNSEIASSPGYPGIPRNDGFGSG